MTDAGDQLDRTLILRLWREGASADAVWRCSVEDPRTKQRRGFSSLAELFPFLDLLTHGFESASLLDVSPKPAGNRGEEDSMNDRLATPRRMTTVAALIIAGLLATGVAPSARAASQSTVVHASSISNNERQALIDLYNTTNGASWTHSTGWNGTAGTECTWYGVTCDGTGTTVQSLDLGFNNLAGSLPTTLGSLTNLTFLDFYNNKLTGSIPDVSNLTKMQQLNLSINQLTGSIPDLSGLTNLQRLDLSYNKLTGSIPLELGNLTSLGYLWLGSNHLTGSIPDLSKLSNLLLLDLSSNQITGSIPTWLGNLTNLQDLYLFSNQLSGSIPDLSSLTKLQQLRLSSNQLTGPIPTWLGSLTGLSLLYLDSNQLSGSIPDLSKLTKMQQLNLSANQLTGSIPIWLGSLTSLGYLWLNSNQLSGSIPTQLGNLTNLRYLYLNSNQLSGSIPDVSKLTKLYYLFLNSNQLVGAVPSSITSLTNLLVFNGSDFRWNGLYSADATVVTFLNAAQVGGDWQSTQTVPVTNLAAGSPTASSITLTWTPITYTGDTGGYEAFYSTTSGGPYSLSGTTADKTASSWPVTGLLAGKPYYFIVKSVTNPHANNQNTVVSDPTAEVSASTSAGLAITTTSPLPAGVVGQPYSQPFTATGGAGGYSWSVTSGSLPPGLTPLSSGGVLSGNPTTAGNYSFTVQVKDAADNTTSDPFTLQINGSQEAVPLFGPLGLLCLIAALGAVGALVVRRLTS